MAHSLKLVTLCTGNATRSVIAQLWLQRACPDLLVIGGGTLSIDGLPMSIRTRSALAGLGLADPGHRSHQLLAEDLVDVDLVLAMEADHVRWIRREHPATAGRTATLRRLLRDLAPGSDSFAVRLQKLDLAQVELEAWEDVVDPAGGDQAEFDRCAAELDELLQQFPPLLEPALE